jgi:predicted NBD/HSP70 family sugar kinase
MADDWHGIRPIKELKERLRARGLTCPLVIDKDANLAALAEQRWGVGVETSDFVFVKWAHGLSAGVMMGGQLLRGVGGSAGALGHIPIVKIERERDDEEEEFPHELWEPDSKFRCRRCGKVDCLEAMIGIDRLIREVGRNRGLSEKNWPTIDDIRLAALTDRAGIEARFLKGAAKRLGNALGAVVNLLNPEFVVIGGSFRRSDYDLLAERVQQGLRHVAIAPTYRDADVRFSDQNVIEGALASVIDHGKVASFLLKKVDASRP